MERAALRIVVAVLLGRSSCRRPPTPTRWNASAGIAAASADTSGARQGHLQVRGCQGAGSIRDTIDCATDTLFGPARLAVETRLFATINKTCGGESGLQ
jgi:hypothetical protein